MTGMKLENEFYRVRVNNRGAIDSLYDGCHEMMVRIKTFHAERHPAVARLREGANWPTDEEIAAKRKMFPPGLILHWVHLPFSPPGKGFQSATVVIRAHEGDWHSAVRYGYQILVGPIRWSTSMDDPQMPELARYIKETIRIREQIKDAIKVVLKWE
jgi:hypothetical protein